MSNSTNLSPSSSPAGLIVPPLTSNTEVFSKVPYTVCSGSSASPGFTLLPFEDSNVVNGLVKSRVILLFSSKVTPGLSK